MSDRERAKLGAWLGLFLGAIYGLVSSVINNLVLWGVPLPFDAGALIVNVLFSGLGMAAVGFVTGYPFSSLRGVLVGALATALFLTLQAFFNQNGSVVERFGMSFVLVAFFLPLAALLLAITTVVRVGINWLEEALQSYGRPRLVRLARVWGGAAVLAFVVASFGQYSPEEQAAIRRVNTLIQQGLSASESVPAPLESIDEFRTRAVADYTLEAATSSSTDTSIAGSTAEQYVTVRARFSNGLVIQCLSGRSLGQIICSEP